MKDLKYTVGYLREQGLAGVKWTRTSNGAPILSAISDDGARFVICRDMWDRAEQVGIGRAFDEYTTLGRFFSVRS